MTETKTKTKTDKIEVRMTPGYKERVRQAAKDQDLSLSDYVKTGINKILPKNKK